MALLTDRDFYDVLGADRDATPDELKGAFRARARSLHPDVSDDPDAAERFAELARAYDVLSRPSARLLYDRFGYVAATPPAAPSTPDSPAPEPRAQATPHEARADDRPAPASEIPAEPSDAATAPPSTPRPRVVNLEVTPLEARHGTTRRVPGLGKVKVPAGAEDGEVLADDGSGWRVRIRIRERDTRLLRWAAAAGAAAAAALFVALVLAPDALALY